MGKPKATATSQQDPALPAIVGRLREAMRDAGYDPESHGSKAKLVRATGDAVDAGTLSRLLKGTRLPGPSILYELAVALRVRPGWLTRGEFPKRVRVGLDRTADPRLHEAVDLILSFQSELGGAADGGGDIPEPSDENPDKS